ncbi:CRC domain-containing protein TSO1 [Acorus calamus]|uniref:CRC domain-containing protein TSO1 n=1 Tax=Acorus calamus TaxID=4465 RepID=A0AAV9EGU9_ACOCL|nr:CRC domain-containing protein TSO1 [Acorus calamus]
MGSKGTKSPSTIEHPLLEGSKSCSVSVNVVDNLSVKPTLVPACSLACTENTKEDYKDAQEMVLVNSSAGFSTSANAPLNIEPLSVVTPIDMKNPTSQGPCRFEEANQLSPRKKSYCDCFAAKRYCSETCICKDCLNKPEYEKFVFNSRQKIESRNPTAFAPKIVQLVTESPQKSGANVGCSNGCRCDNCKNTFGSRKGSARITKVDDRKAEDEEYEKDISDENVDTVNISDATHQRKPSLFSPMTPLVPCSNASAISLHKKSPISTRSSTGTKRIVKLGEGGASLLPHDLELDECGKKKLDKSSSGWDGIGDICQVNALSHPSVEAPTSKSGIVRMSRAPVRWRRSPGTPMPQFGGSKFITDSVSGIYSIPENDTPDMLKDAQTPIKTVKISSPKQKRVSSPKKFHGLSSLSSSPGLRTSRKLVLQSMPSLTSDSEGSEK